MPISQDELNALFADAREEWNRAELIVKTAEQVSGDAVIPSIKELRYAGRRFVDTFHELANGNDLAKAQGFVQDAIFNCHCARHDAIDVATAVIASNLNVAVQKIGYRHVLSAFPKFAELRSQLTAIRAKIRVSRENRTDRDAIYDAIHEGDFPQLAALYEEYLGAEDIMKSLARGQRRREVFYVVTTIGAILVALYASLKPEDCPQLSLPAGAIITVPKSPATPSAPAGKRLGDG